MYRAIAVAILGGILVGCVTPNYIEPSGANTSSLKVTTKTLESWNQRLSVFGDKDCRDYPGQLINFLQSKVIGNDTKESTQTVIPSGELVTISVFAAVPRDDSFLEMFFKGIERTAAENRYCEAFVTFVPEAGATYHAVYKIDGSPCSLDVMKVVDGQGLTVTGARANSSCSRIAKDKFGTQLLTN